MQRRDFLAATATGMAAAGLGATLQQAAPRLEQWSSRGPVHAVVPVVGDGKWIWTKPPENQTGYLEPRSFSLDIGVEIEGRGGAGLIRASTPVPTSHPEQKVEEVRIETQGCEAQIRELAPGAAQLQLAAPQIAKGQIVRAIARYKLTLTKQYQGYAAEQFPARQPPPPMDVRNQYLQDSPGIQTSSPQVKKLAAELTAQVAHPFDRARAFADWTRKHIRPQIGPYTSVVTALEKRIGDCEEMASVVVALCRAVNIPARLVWVPNHNWAEFYLQDEEGAGHWIPVHTACYSWFGWTGVHELVLQKGDRVKVPEQRKQFRLLEDWVQWGGVRPEARFVAELTPQRPGTASVSAASAGGASASSAPAQPDPGPGARRKEKTGEWKLLGTHPDDRHLRQQ